MKRKRWLCVKSDDESFTVGNTYLLNVKGHLIDNKNDSRLPPSSYNYKKNHYVFKELNFKDYVKQCERLVDSGLPKGKGV